ncbi:hypothetical protein CBL_05183 [Carabus blaptoides fortunei]
MNRATASGGAYGFVTNRKRVIIAVVAFVISLHMIAASAQMFNDYPELTLSKPEFRHEASGAFIRLKCSMDPCHPTDIFRWEYKACGSDLHRTECHNSENIEWMPILKNIKSKKCSSTHLIKNATGRYSGLYRCSKVIPESDQDVRVVKIFELCVIEKPTAKDTGIYACFAVNLFGSSDRDVLVTVTPPKYSGGDYRETVKGFVRALNCMFTIEDKDVVT